LHKYSHRPALDALPTKLVEPAMSSASRLALILSAALSGCAIVTSERITGDPPSAVRQGLPYMLPKAVLPIDLVDSGGSLRIDLKMPVMVGDPDYAYALNPVINAFSSDILRLAVDPKTGLLTSIDLDSTDKTGEVLKQILVTRGVRAESAEAAGGEQVLFSGFLDPGVNDATVNAQLNQAVQLHLAAKRAGCVGAAADTEVCKSYSALALRSANTPVVTVSAQAVRFVPAASASQNFRSATSSAVEAPECGKGICHRGVRPHEITITLFGQSQSTIAQLPNGAPVMSLPLSAQPFVQVKHKVTFVDGMVQGYDADRPSSALAIVSWPLDVYKAILTATSELLQLKIDTSQKQTAWSQEQLDAAKKLKEIAEEMDTLRQPKPESALFAPKRSGGSLSMLSVSTAPARTTALPREAAAASAAASTAPSGVISGGSDGTQPNKRR
jgi:hypothetical protein